jgi:hypothetical protein
MLGFVWSYFLWDIRGECEGDGDTECGDGDSDIDS